MSKLLKTLKNITLFSSLAEDQLQEIGSIISEKKYRKNEVVFHQGDPGSVLFIIQSGAVKISLLDGQGKEVILKMLYENDFFGEMSLLDGNFRSATITAIEDTVALKIYREDFIRLIQRFPSLALNMLVALSRRMRKADEKIASLTFSDAYGKTARVLLDLLEKEKGASEKASDSLELSFSRQEMANMAGISRETFTRILHEFQVRGCLRVEGKKIVIQDESILRREVF